MFEDLFGGSVGAAQSFGNNEYDFVRDPDTVASNALQSMQPIQASTMDNGWSGFWQDTTKSLLQYAVKKDQAQTASGTSSSAIAAAQARAAIQSRQLLLFAGIGLVVYMVAVK